jgi:cation transport ATPase
LIELRDHEIFGLELRQDLLVTFLRRVFALTEVKSVEVDRAEAVARIRVDSSRYPQQAVLGRLANVIHGHNGDTVSPLSVHLMTANFTKLAAVLEFRRFGSVLTTWDIVSQQRGRVRFRNAAIRGKPELANQIRDFLYTIAGVKDCTVQQLTGSVLVRFDPQLVDTMRLLGALDRSGNAPASQTDPIAQREPGGYGLANVSLALAVTGQLAVPALLPVSAVLLVGSNLDTFWTAGRQLTRGQFGLPVLYSTIVAATLASGQFIASSTMGWMLTFWRRTSHHQILAARRRLLGELLQQPRRVRVVLPQGIDVEIDVENLHEGDIIVVSEGDIVPVDGVVLEGHGLVDERIVRGLDGLVQKKPDNLIFAGSAVASGELYIEVRRQGADTQAAALSRAVLAAIAPSPRTNRPYRHGEAAAEGKVAPTLALAGVGLLIGDLTTAGAILRPDYTTGPGLAFPLETLQALAVCVRHGIVIRNPRAIEQLATVNLLVLDHNPTLEYAALELEGVEVFPGETEEQILRYAWAAYRDLHDERAIALRDACNSRDISIRGLQPREFDTDITLFDGASRVKVGALGSRSRDFSKPRPTPDRKNGQPTVPDSLMVGINGRVAGLIHFRRSNRLQAASSLHRLCAKRKLQFGIVSDASDSKVNKLATMLGADFHLAGHSVDDRLELLRACRYRGFKVAYIGTEAIDPRIIAESHVAISLLENGFNGLEGDQAPIAILRPQITRLTELWDIAHIHQQRLKVAHRYALVPNLLCIAGAFVWGFTSLTSVIVTNLATYGIYRRTASSIRNLERQIARASNHQHLRASQELTNS